MKMKRSAALLMSLLCGFGLASPAAATDPVPVENDTRPLGFYRLAPADPAGRVIEKQAAEKNEAAADSAAPADWQADVEKNIRRAEYEISWQRSPAPGIPDAYQAPNRAQGFRIRFTENGATLAPHSDDAETARNRWTWGLRLVRFGAAGNTAAVLPGSPSVRANRAEYDHGVLTEWFVNDEKGLEQGFTILEPVTAASDSDAPAAELHLDLAISGNLFAYPSEDRQSIEFRDCLGARVIRYGELFSHDARGRSLPSRMEVLAPAEGLSAVVRIVVDAAGAVYPVTIDPLTTSPAWTAESDQIGAEFGNVVASAGDVNGDGYSDVIVGADLFDNGQTNEGKAFLYLGSATGLATTPAWTAESDQASAIFGVSVASAGDVNGDGYSDVIVGAHVFDNGETNEGRAFLYLGSAAGLAATPAWTAESDQLDARFGYPVASAGDVNGDGYSDVIVGAWQFDNGQTNEGRAFLYLGSAAGLAATPAWTAEGNQSSAEFGISLASAGDANGDGYSDVIVGAQFFDNGQTNEGRTFLYLGSAGGLAATPAWIAESDQAFALFGYSVASAGDVNNDGYSDAIVGAAYFDNGQGDEGMAFLYMGSAAGLAVTPAWSAESDAAQANFGYSVASAGDVDGDGYSDVIVGAPLFGSGQYAEGKAYLYLGSGAGLAATPDWTDESDQASAIFGSSVASAGDVDGDGYSDAIVGAQFFDNGEADEGRAFVYLGSAAPMSADLGVVKTDSPDPVVAGGTLTYTITATNAGPHDASSVTVIDTLPAAVVFVSATPSQGACSQAGGVVTCNLGTMLSGGSATIVVVVTAPAVGTLSNSISISGTEPDPNAVNNNDTEATTVTAPVDLVVTKSDSPDPVVAGATLTYTVTASNTGPSDATNVAVVDTLPAGVVFVSATPTQGTCSEAGGFVTCNAGALANGASATITIAVTAPSAAGSIINQAAISGAEADPDPSDNGDTEATTVTASADLVVTKTDSPDPVAPGATLTYTVTASNTGPSAATAVTVVDTLPAGVAFVSATPTQGSCSQAGGVVTCNVGGLASGVSATITIVVTAPSTVGSIDNQATISGAENDPDPSDNSDTETTRVTPLTDLTVTKTDSPDPVAAGATLTYTVTATNNGPSVATGVTVVDTLPAGVIFVSATPTQGTCSEAGGVVTCNVGALASGASAASTIVVTAPSATGSITNQATISGAEADPDPSDNSETEATTVTASADITVTKTDSPDPVVAGATLTYIVTASNTGPSAATGVVVVDTLPAGVVFVSATPAQGVCSQAGLVVTCIVGVLANGASATISIVVTAPSAAGSISNQATISGAVNDPDPSDNGDTEVTTVIDPCAGETVAPVVTPPPSTTVDASICAGNQPGATGNSSAPLAAFIAGGSATDDCDTTPTRLPAQVGGADIDNTTFFPIGTTTVTFRFIDDAGNIGSATADVTVDVFYGDLNEDNLINAGDSVILANYLVGNLAQGVPPFTAPLNAADLNNSGGVNSVDSVILANFLVGNITCLPQP